MNIRRMYQELIATSILLNILDSLLTAIFVFSIAYIGIYFYRINFLFAIGIALIFFIRSFYVKKKQNKILILEHKYPDLKERLRTSYDYQDKTNTIIDQLHKDIVKAMRSVDVSAFLDSKKLFMKTVVICGLLFSTLYFSSIGFDILNIRDTIVKTRIYQKTSEFAKDLFDETRDEIKNRPLLEESRLIQLGNNEMNISIDTYNTELDIDQIGDTEKNDFGGHYPEEILGAAQETYDEKIPEEHKDVIKEYFKKINE